MQIHILNIKTKYIKLLSPLDLVKFVLYESLHLYRRYIRIFDEQLEVASQNHERKHIYL